MRLAQDVKEALLGGSLVSQILFFKIHAFIYLFLELYLNAPSLFATIGV